MPACLLVGRCVEVWAPGYAPAAGYLSGWRRFGVVAEWWRRSADRADNPRRSAGAPWSVTTDPVRAAERLAAAGVTLADLPDLAAEATRLHARARRERDSRREVSKRPS